MIADDDFRLRKLLLTYTQMVNLQFMERSCIESSITGTQSQVDHREIFDILNTCLRAFRYSTPAGGNPCGRQASYNLTESF